MKIILASQSPRRSDILNMLGYDFEVIPSEYEEDNTFSSDPDKLCSEHAVQKAQEVYSRIGAQSETCILGADTIVYLENEIIGKPKDKADARNMMKKLSGKTHVVKTGVALIDAENGDLHAYVESTEVTFDEISDEEVEEYLVEAHWQDKAGAYAVQGQAAKFIIKVDGDFFNVVGLPVNSLYKLLEQLKRENP